jgi:hypothetical protein
LATSGLGYIYENAQGQISYADSTHTEPIIWPQMGMSILTANHALASGLSIQSRAGDVRNTIDLKYGNNSALEVNARLIRHLLAFMDNSLKFLPQQSNTRPMLKIRPISI